MFQVDFRLVIECITGATQCAMYAMTCTRNLSRTRDTVMTASRSKACDSRILPCFSTARCGFSSSTSPLRGQGTGRRYACKNKLCLLNRKLGANDTLYVQEFTRDLIQLAVRASYSEVFLNELQRCTNTALEGLRVLELQSFSIAVSPALAHCTGLSVTSPTVFSGQNLADPGFVRAARIMQWDKKKIWKQFLLEYEGDDVEVSFLAVSLAHSTL